MAAYLEILNGQYTINKDLTNYSEKMALIDLALKKYPQDTAEERGALSSLRQALEEQLRAESLDLHVAE